MQAGSPPSVSGGAYDPHDTVMSHQTFCQRHFRASSKSLLAEYISACSQFSDTLTARTLHQEFVNRIGFMRALLVTQRTGKAGGKEEDDSSAAGSPTSGGVASVPDSASVTSGGGSSIYIVRHDWSRAHCKKLSAAWNSRLEEVTDSAIEAAVAWLCEDDDFEHFKDVTAVGEHSAYLAHMGIVAQKWPTDKAAKDFVNSLHAVINAPGSDFFTPMAITCTILGTPIVFLSLAPVVSVHNRWTENTQMRCAVDGLCAGLHFFRTAFPKGLGNHSAVATLTQALQAQYSQLSSNIFTNLHVAVGHDARWYILDARSLTLRGHLATTTHVVSSVTGADGASYSSPDSTVALGRGWTVLGAGSRNAIELATAADAGAAKAGTIAGPVPVFYNTTLADRFPRRECLFSLTGNRNTPYSPQEFVHRFKLRAVSEYLLHSLDDILRDTILLSSIAHAHGVTYGANVYPIYHSLSEQEYLFKSSIASTNQRAQGARGGANSGLTPAARQRLQLFKQARNLVVTDVLARVVKRTIKEECRRIVTDKGFLRSIRDALQQDEDGSGSGPASGRNSVISNGSFDNAFVAFGGGDASRNSRASTTQTSASVTEGGEQGAQVVSFRAFASSINKSPSVSSTARLHKQIAGAINEILAAVFTWRSTPSRGGGHRKPADSDDEDNESGEIVVRERMFSELLFIANDAFIGKMIVPTGKPGSVTFCFEMELEDVRVPHMVGLLEEMLGVDLVMATCASQPAVCVDPQSNLLDGFFDLNNDDVPSVLRSGTIATVIDIPLPLAPGSKSKVTEHAALQHKLASKLVSLIDVSLPADLLHYCIDTAKHAFLHAYDVRIAHRGIIADTDFAELFQIHSQVPAPHSPRTTEMLLSFEAMVAYRRSWFGAVSDLPGSLRHLMKFTERLKSISDAQTSPASKQANLKGSSATLAAKVRILLKAGERFSTITLSTALEAAVMDIDAMMEDGVINASEQRRRGGGSVPTAVGGKAAFKELTMVQAGYLLLQPLAMLVKYHSQPTVKRNLSESLGTAVRHAGDRRDVIVQIYGEASVEAGVACNDVAAICSTNKYDFERAEEEFERAVAILQKAQPEGPVIFVTINNLAFLYFRKAERLRKSVAQATVAASDGDAVAVTKGVNMRVADLLRKAENLLNDVIRAEGRLSSHDVAAALNNLASIKMFQERYWDAKALFNRTLILTEDEVQPGIPELPCRVYAIRNLKSLARKQYLRAVLLVQACIRRYVTRLRKRKEERSLQGVTPIQHLGRAFLARRRLAAQYKFSAFYFWMKIPRLYTRKLPVASWSLPASMREREWNRLLGSSVLLLQRVIRGSEPRRRLGPVVSFVFHHFSSRRPALENEVMRRRCMAFSQFGLQQASRYAAHFSQVLSSTVYTPGLLVEEAYFRRQSMDNFRAVTRNLLLSAADSRRLAIVCEEERVLGSFRAFYQVNTLEQQEVLGRRHIAAMQLEGASLQWRMLQTGLFMSHASTTLQREHVVTGLLIQESRLRRRIELGYVAAVCGPVVSRTLHRVGRGFQIRRWLRRLQRCQTKETVERDSLDLSQEDAFVHLGRQLRHQMGLSRWQALEQERRRVELNEAEAHQWQQLVTRSPVVTLIEECNARSAIQIQEGRAVLFNMFLPEVYWRSLLTHYIVQKEALVDASLIITASYIRGVEEVEWSALTRLAVSNKQSIRLAHLQHKMDAIPEQEKMARATLTQWESMECLVLYHRHATLANIIPDESTSRSALRTLHLDGKAAIDAKEAHIRKARAERDAVEATETNKRFGLASEEGSNWLSMASHALFTEFGRLNATSLADSFSELSIHCLSSAAAARSITMWGELMEWGERSQRRAILDQERSECLYKLSLPVERNLKAIVVLWLKWANSYTTGYGPSSESFIGTQVSAEQAAILPSSRQTILDEEIRARVELHAFSQKLHIMYRFATDERFLAKIHDIETCVYGSIEHAARRGLEEEQNMERVAIVKQTVESSARACIYLPWERDIWRLQKMYVEASERAWRKRSCAPLEHQARVRLYYQYVESSARIRIKHEQQLSSTALALQMLHSAYVVERLVQPCTALLQRQHDFIVHEISRRRMMAALHTLGGFALASLARRRMWRLRALRNELSSAIQRAGRGFLARSRFIRVARAAADMEYEETLTRAETIASEVVEREGMEKYQQLVGAAFLRAVRKGAASRGYRATLIPRNDSAPILSRRTNSSAAPVVHLLVASPIPHRVYSPSVHNIGKSEGDRDETPSIIYGDNGFTSIGSLEASLPHTAPHHRSPGNSISSLNQEEPSPSPPVSPRPLEQRSRLYSAPAWATANMHNVLLGKVKVPTPVAPPTPRTATGRREPAPTPAPTRRRPQSANPRRN